MNNQQWAATGAFLLALAVTLGAFGAHALNEMLVASGRLETFNTGVEYHFYHALGLLAIGLAPDYLSSRQTNWVGGLLVAGIVFFSGSLYLICFTGLTFFGMVAPIGGTAFIAGWVVLGAGLLRRRK